MESKKTELTETVDWWLLEGRKRNGETWSKGQACRDGVNKFWGYDVHPSDYG